MGTHVIQNVTNRMSDFLEMTKPGICVLAMVMATLGFWLGSPDGIETVSFLMALVGIALVGASSGVLNQYIERELDAQMWRTLDRPLPSGRIQPGQALVFGIVLAVIGEAVLFFGVNVITAVLGAITLFVYLCVYTPAKRMSTLSTLIGAFPGAMPPLLGWTAAQGSIGRHGLILFGILFLWQIPHFLAIAWIYREDYSRANFPILTVVDHRGGATIRQILLYSVILVPITLIPTIWGLAGHYYFYGAIFLGALFLSQGIWLAIYRTKLQARRLFFASLIYLPVLGVLMAWDRVL
jgi:heme o synthase